MSLTVNTFDNSFDSCNNVSFDMDETSPNSTHNIRKGSTNSNNEHNDNHIPQTEHNINIKLIHAISKTLNQVLRENQRLQCYPFIIKEQIISVFSARTRA